MMIHREMKKIISMILFLLIAVNVGAQISDSLITKINQDNALTKNDERINSEPNRILTLEYFKINLNRNMNRDSIEKVFGKPVEDLGSGLFIYQYNLVDSSSIFITFHDSILQAIYVGHKMKELKYLIEMK